MYLRVYNDNCVYIYIYIYIYIIIHMQFCVVKICQTFVHGCWKFVLNQVTLMSMLLAGPLVALMWRLCMSSLAQDAQLFIKIWQLQPKTRWDCSKRTQTGSPINMTPDGHVLSLVLTGTPS